MTELRYERWFLPLSVPLGMGPANSSATVEGDTLHVAMGWAFAADIPLASITDAKPNSGRVLGWGVHGWRGRWLVNGSSQGIVELTIDPPVQARVLGVSTTLRNLRVSVTDPDAFIASLHRG